MKKILILFLLFPIFICAQNHLIKTDHGDIIICDNKLTYRGVDYQIYDIEKSNPNQITWFCVFGSGNYYHKRFDLQIEGNKIVRIIERIAKNGREVEKVQPELNCNPKNNFFEWEGVGKYDRNALASYMATHLDQYLQDEGLNGDLLQKTRNLAETYINGVRNGLVGKKTASGDVTNNLGLDSNGDIATNFLGSRKATDSNASAYLTGLLDDAIKHNSPVEESQYETSCLTNNQTSYDWIFLNILKVNSIESY